MIWYVIVIWVFSGFLCAYIASQKNRGDTGWFFAGLAFGIFAIIAIVAVPSLSEEERKRKMGRSDSIEAQIASEAKQEKQMGQSFFDPAQRAMRERSNREEDDERDA